MPKLIPDCPIDFKFSAGRKYFLYDPDDSSEKSILEARGLVIFSDYKFILKDAVADESLFYKYISLNDGQVLGMWQSVITSYPLEIKFSTEHYHDIYVDVNTFPKYDFGNYILDGVFLTKVYIEPHCCDGKVYIRHARGVYECIRHKGPDIILPKFPECTKPLIMYDPIDPNPLEPPESEPKFPECIEDQPVLSP